MIIKGQAVSEKGVNYRLNFLKYGQETIKQFRLLYKILKDFPDFSESKYDENYFLILASKAKHDIFQNGPNMSCLDKLKEYENLLNKLDFENIKSRKRKDIAKKMNSFDKQQNHAICKEIEFLLQLKNHPNIREAFYDNFEKSNHDFRIMVNDTFFNLEFTSTSDGYTSKILERVFDRISEELMSYISDGKYLKLDLKTDLLLDDSNKMNEEYIFKLVIEKVKLVLPAIFVKDNGYCTIDTRMGDPNKPFYESRDHYQHYREWGERLGLLLMSEEGKKFLMKTSIASLGKFPISRFMYYSSGAKIVEVHSQSQWPSRSEELRKMALLNQLSRLLTSKIDKGQLKGQENPIIVVQFADVIFDEYLNDNDPFGPGKLEELQELINDAFTKTSNSEILGVLLIENSLSKSKFIPNINIKIGGDLLIKISTFSKLVK